jgi:hypothetical protein
MHIPILRLAAKEPLQFMENIANFEERAISIKT